MREDDSKGGDFDDDLPPKVRLLRALVYALGVVLAVGGAAVIALAFWRLGTAGNELARRLDPALPDAAGPPSTAKLALPEGAAIVAMTLDHDRLALRLRLASGAEEVRVVNWRSGALLGTLAVETEPAAP
jgi:hypothetical protein